MNRIELTGRFNEEWAKHSNGVRDLRWSSNIVEQDLAELRRTHNGQWVAIFQGQILVAPTHEEIFEQATLAGFDLRSTAIASTDANPRSLMSSTYR